MDAPFSILSKFLASAWRNLSGVGPRGPGKGRGFGPVQPAYLPGGQAASRGGLGRLGSARRADFCTKNHSEEGAQPFLFYMFYMF